MEEPTLPLSSVNEISSKMKSLDFVETTQKEENKQSPSQLKLQLSQTSLICDAWYGFPSQKRPRQERILGVSRQIFNYITWNNEYLKVMKRKRKTNIKIKKQNSNEKSNSTTSMIDFLNWNATMYIIGKNEDVKSIQERVENLISASKKTSHSSSDGNNDGNNGDSDNNGSETATDNVNDNDDWDMTKCIYLPGMKLEDLCEKLRSITKTAMTTSTTTAITTATTATTATSGMKANATNSKSIVYLSPDASNKLNPKEIPPSIIIIGMLVDRKVQSNRSKSRAEQIIMTMQQEQQEKLQQKDEQDNNKVMIIEGKSSTTSFFDCAQLPLDILNVRDLGSDEALNIDTVLEMVQRWWYNSINSASSAVGKANVDDNRNVDIGASVKENADQNMYSFKDAAARALLTHRNRHPKRTIHGSTMKAK
jgi:hypothetical protein